MQFRRSAEFQTLKKFAIVRLWDLQKIRIVHPILILTYRSAGSIRKSLTFLEFSRLLNPSVPHRRLFFPSSSDQSLFHSAAASCFGYTRKLLTVSIFSYPVRRGTEESKEENRSDEIQVRGCSNPFLLVVDYLHTFLFKMVVGSLEKILFAS